MAPREIIRKLHAFNRLHSSEVRLIMESEGLYFGQLPILEIVSEKGKCTQKEIVDALKVSAPSVAVSVKRLVKHGYLIKSNDEKDQRATLVSISEKGQMVAKACRQKFDELDARLFADFSEHDKECFHALIEKLNQQFEKEGQHD